MASGGAGLIVSSQTGYMYPIPYEEEQKILNTETDKLMELPFITETAMQNSGYRSARVSSSLHLPMMSLQHPEKGIRI